MIEKAATNVNLLQLAFRTPSITAYNRLEPRPRTENFERSIRAEVRDALWMLTRQWQMGELEAEDAGSAIDARLVAKKTHIDRIALNGNIGRNYDDTIPMETFVERSPIPFTYALKIQMSQYFLKMHSAALRDKYLPNYKAAYAMDNTQQENFRGQIDGLNLYQATKNRVLDGEKVYKDIVSGNFSAAAGIDIGDAGPMAVITEGFQKWFERQYSQPVDNSDNAWHPQQLDYQFSIAAPEATGSQVVLEAKQYFQGRLDWYAFDNVLRPQPLTVDDAQPAVEEVETISFLPTATAFKGMPNPRFWEMEDRQIDFGKLNAKTTDHLLLCFAEFGLVYGNDWFVIPYSLPVNTLCQIEGLVVTDVFGERTLVRASDEGADNDWQRWSMFNLSNRDNMGQYNRLFFLPSALSNTLESDPVEQVNFIRDEMANMVWGIEDIITDGTGKGINGSEAADKTGVLPPVITGSTADIRYLLGTTVPENWIPFLPVQKPASNQEIYFQRAAMPKMGVPPHDIIKAKGTLLNEVPTPYYINEEEIPYSGTIVTISYQRARSHDGRTFLWLGRARETGRGEGNSMLRFDQVEAIANAQ